MYPFRYCCLEGFGSKESHATSVMSGVNVAPARYASASKAISVVTQQSLDATIDVDAQLHQGIFQQVT
jgi:hypothetical protein